MADRRNALELANGGSAVHGITNFSDLSQAEFESHYLTADEKMKSSAAGTYISLTVWSSDSESNS